MAHTAILISVLGAGLAFGASFAMLALLGLGVPVLLAALAGAACAGLVLHAVLLARVVRPMTALEAGRTGAEAAADARVHEIEARTAALRHDLRGVLSPALMVSDRLLTHQDPAIQRAGQAIVRSVERATTLIQVSKGEDPAASAAAPPDRAAG